MHKAILAAAPTIMMLCSALAAQSGRRIKPISPGVYCLKQHLTGYTGTGHDYDLGNFLMAVEVKKERGRYTVWISNRMPDNPQVLEADTDNARVLRDGSLAFRFTDGWDNEGKARLYRNGKVELVMTKRAPMNQIGRNYGSFIVSKSGCAGVKF